MFMFQKAHFKEKEKSCEFKFSLLFSIQIEYVVKERSMSRFSCLKCHNTSFSSCFVSKLCSKWYTGVWLAIRLWFVPLSTSANQRIDCFSQKWTWPDKTKEYQASLCRFSSSPSPALTVCANNGKLNTSHARRQQVTKIPMTYLCKKHAV